MARMDSRTLLVAVLVGAAVGSFVACSGKTESTSSGGASGGSSSGEPNDGGFTIGCPSTVPATRTTANGAKNPCTQEGQICEYGTDFDPRCNTVVTCSNGEWAVPFQSGGGNPPKCGSPAPTVPPNASDCPTAQASITDGQSCTAKSACSYDGATCSCGVFCPSFPVGQRECDADAGITTSCCDRTKPPTWHCFEGPPYCKTPRPHLGDPCSTNGDSCALTEPSECGQTILRCDGKVWTLPRNECPISTAKAKRDIAYLAPTEAERLRDDLLRVKLASYRYKSGDPGAHLGFIIEDMPQGSPAVLASREQVDLYGYVSMTVAAIQAQQKQIERLEAELAKSKRDCR